MSAVQYAAFAFFPLLMAYAAASDLLSMTISNKVSLLLVGGFVVMTPIVGMDLATFGTHLAAGGIVLGAGFAFFAFGWIGGGDAKVAASAALWLGLSHTFDFLLQGALYGGVLTVGILIIRSRLLPAFALRQSWIMRLHDPDAGVPYGVALSVAALMVYPHTVWMGLVVG